MSDHRNFLTHLKNISKNKKKRNKMLRKANQAQINSIRNICYNVCRKKVKLCGATRERLYPYRKDIRDLANKRKLKSIDGVKRRLEQRGGFLPILLPAVLSLLSTVGSRVISKTLGV